MEDMHVSSHFTPLRDRHMLTRDEGVSKIINGGNDTHVVWNDTHVHSHPLITTVESAVRSASLSRLILPSATSLPCCVRPTTSVCPSDNLTVPPRR